LYRRGLTLWERGYNLDTPNNHPVLELRVAFTVTDFDRVVKFYCNGLGIEPAAVWNNGDGHALVLDMGQATLELFDEAQAETIDSLEAGKRLSGQIRFALQVPDLHAATDQVGAEHAPPLRAHGATLVHPPVMTPWGDYNVRLQDPDGMQITLFQVMNSSSPS
jgi:catechol 2,3-dioxygenase-like lactoylglutathione lyase family enzyme